MKIALVIAGAESWRAEKAEAEALCKQAVLTVDSYSYVNDHIASLPLSGRAVSLHPDKLPGWLDQRTRAGLVKPREVWAHRACARVTHTTNDWGGSSALFAVKIEKQLAATRIILCGAPLDPKAGHFMRHREWRAALSFRHGWNNHMGEIKGLVKSMSGWTAEQLGKPTLDWLMPKGEAL